MKACHTTITTTTTATNTTTAAAATSITNLTRYLTDYIRWTVYLRKNWHWSFMILLRNELD